MQLVFALLAALPVAQAAGQDEARAQASAPHRRSRSGRIAGSSSSADGTKARVKLLDVEEERDGVRSAIREARVKVEVNGQADDAGLRQLPPAGRRSAASRSTAR